jgi:uncharacterized protein
MLNKRSYLDPIHQDIVLDRNKPAERLVMDLIDTPEFQRLRRIHQLGVSFFTFQGAEGSRFTHSVGVMRVASLLTDLLAEKSLSAAEQKPLILATALLHDLGHGPYSHVTEKILDYDHEDWSCKIISGDTVVNEVLRDFDPALPATITGVLKKTHMPHWISHMVSSQLDCDRMDYLLRDSYMTGTAYGLFAIQRILTSLEIDEAADRIIVSGEKGQIAVEDYLFARYSMYAQVYYHKKNLAARALLKKLLSRAREIGDKLNFVDEPTAKLLRRENLHVSEYLQLDDVSMTYHIKRWMSDKDKVLADLASRFINRKLFKATKLPSGNAAEQQKIVDRAKRIVAERGLDPEYYVSTESTGLRPYDYYRPDVDHPQTNIMVRTDGGQIRELSTLSTPVEALVKGDFETYCLVYPDEVGDKIAQLFEPAACR